MPVVKKENRVLTVEESSVTTYLKQGYDEVELNKAGTDYEIVKRATGGKTVSYAEYVVTVEENESLKAEVKLLKAELAKAKKVDV